jgi:thioredoxin 1
VHQWAFAGSMGLKVKHFIVPTIPMIASLDEKSFRSEVLNSHSPVIVSFWTPWCGPCRMIEPLLLTLQKTGTQPVKVFRVNADDNFWLAKRYELITIPTLLLFHQGQVVHRLERVSDRKEVLSNLKSALESIPTYSLENSIAS